MSAKRQPPEESRRDVVLARSRVKLVEFRVVGFIGIEMPLPVI